MLGVLQVVVIAMLANVVSGQSSSGHDGCERFSGNAVFWL